MHEGVGLVSWQKENKLIYLIGQIEMQLPYPKPVLNSGEYIHQPTLLWYFCKFSVVLTGSIWSLS